MRQYLSETMLPKATSSKTLVSSPLRKAKHCLCCRSNRVHAEHGLDVGISPVESACTVRKAEIGLNPAGFRGLIALEFIGPGDVVLSVPLCNTLQVPRELESPQAVAAAQEALELWQRYHGQLPAELLDLIMDPMCPWEAKLVYWLLHLKAAAAPNTLWHSYCQHLPTQQETLSFFCYSQQQAEQLQFSTWKNLAASHRQLLQDVQQHCSRLPSVAAAAAVTPDDITWALSMVKSRTFARALPQQQQPVSDSSQGISSVNTSESQSSRQSQGLASNRLDEQQLDSRQQEMYDDDEADIMLLMVPFVDMINHAPESNCAFNLDWQNQCFQIISTSRLQPGSEITICYGSNKSNLALLSSYGFFIPGNQNEARLLQPVFKAAVAAAGAVDGLQQDLVQAAVAARLQELQQDGINVAAADVQMHVSRLHCAAASLPVQSGPADVGGLLAEDLQKRLQLHRYAVELIKYQIRLMLKLCETTVEQDAVLLQGAAAGHDSANTDELISHVITAARLEHKELLLECQRLCQHMTLDAVARTAA